METEKDTMDPICGLARSFLFEKIIEKNKTYQRVRGELMEKIRRAGSGTESPFYTTVIPVSELARPGESFGIKPQSPGLATSDKKIRPTDLTSIFDNGGIFSSFAKGSEWPGTLYVLTQRDLLQANVTMKLARSRYATATVPGRWGLLSSDPPKFDVGRLKDDDMVIELQIYVPELDETYFQMSSLVFDRLVGPRVRKNGDPVPDGSVGKKEEDVSFRGTYQNPVPALPGWDYGMQEVPNNSFRISGIFPTE